MFDVQKGEKATGAIQLDVIQRTEINGRDRASTDSFATRQCQRDVLVRTFSEFSTFHSACGYIDHVRVFIHLGGYVVLHVDGKGSLARRQQSACASFSRPPVCSTRCAKIRTLFAWSWQDERRVLRHGRSSRACTESDRDSTINVRRPTGLCPW